MRSIRTCLLLNVALTPQRAKSKAENRAALTSAALAQEACEQQEEERFTVSQTQTQ